MNSARLPHRQNVHKEKGENQVGWFRETPAISLEAIAAVHPNFDSAVVDIGGCVAAGRTHARTTLFGLSAASARGNARHEAA